MSDPTIKAYKRRLLEVIKKVNDLLYKELAFLDEEELSRSKELNGNRKES